MKDTVMAVDLSKYLEKARAAVRKKNYVYAMDLYKQALTLAPDNAEVRTELRKVQSAASPAQEEKTGGFSGLSGSMFGLYDKIKNKTSSFMPPKTKEAAEKQMINCEEVLCKNPYDINTLEALGRAAKIAGHFNAAVQTYESIAQIAKDEKIKRAADKERAHCYEERKQDGDMKQAYEIWIQLSKSDDTDRESMQRARDLAAVLQHGKLETSLKDQREGATARNQQTDEQKLEARKLQLTRSMEFRDENDFKLGIEIYEDKIKERPDDPANYASKGDLYMKMNRYREALADYKKAQEMAPNDYRWVMREHDLKIKAEENELVKIKQLASNGDEKAKAEYQERYKKLAIFKLQSFEKREQEYPTDIPIKYTLAEVYMQFKKYKEALQRFQVACNDPKYRIRSLLQLGKCFMVEKQTEIAISRFSEGINSIEIMNKQKMELLYARAECYESMNKPAEAKTDYLAIFEHDVSFKDVAQKVEKLRSA
jgi:tetratricopeptide (TPR) repeat protein